MIVFTAAYVYPINAVLFEQAGGEDTAAGITAMVRRWIWADRLRFGVGIIAFAAILRAFRLPTGAGSARMAGRESGMLQSSPRL